MRKEYFILFILFFFILSCTKEDELTLGGEKIDFQKNKITVDEESFSQGAQLNAEVKNKNWHQKGGNIHHSLSNVYFQFPIKQKWSFDTDQEKSDDFPFLVEPVSHKNGLYVLNNDGVLLCLNKKNGRLIWEKKIFDYLDNSLLGGGSLVINPKDNEIFILHSNSGIVSMNLKSQKINWKISYPIPFRGSMTFFENSLLLNDYHGYLLKISSKNGNILWKKKLGSSPFSIYTNARPIVVEKKIINPGTNGIFHILNFETGNLIYSDILGVKKDTVSYFDNNDILANPIYFNGYFYFLSHSGNLSVYDKSFQNVWNKPIGSKNTPLVSGGSVFVFDNSGILYALNVKNGKLRWKNIFQVKTITGYFFDKKTLITFKGPFLVGNKILLFNSEGAMFVINPDNGLVEKKIKIGQIATSPLSFTNEMILLFSNGKISSYN